MGKLELDIHSKNKEILLPLREAQYNFDADSVKAQLNAIFHPDVKIKLAYPFEDIEGAMEYYARAYAPLFDAIPDLERRDTIVMSGPSVNDTNWVGCCGYYTGSFEKDWLDIPATGHQVSMRFHEFYRFESNKVVEVQALWDIPEVMLQADAWPMVPSLGREWLVPGPSTQDGIVIGPYDVSAANASKELVLDMCMHLGKFASGGVEAMRLPDFWHPRCSWYGPSGIGTGRGIKGFRNWHQIPFLNGLPDRVGEAEEGYMFSDQNYVGFTAWPGMHMSVTGDGWLGIAPSGQKITMRSLDFWRCENGLIRENWVLVDLLHVYHQLGVDVFSRMKEFNKARR